MTIEDMRIELDEYLEAAGFADVYNQILSQKNDKEIQEMYKNTFAEWWCSYEIFWIFRWYIQFFVWCGDVNNYGINTEINSKIYFRFIF